LVVYVIPPNISIKKISSIFYSPVSIILRWFFTIIVSFIDWIIITIAIQITFNQHILINKPIPHGIVIPGSKVVESSFYIIDMPPIAERLDRTQGGSERTGGREHLAPGIIGILDHFCATGVQDAHNVPLEIVDVSVLGAVELHNHRAVAGIVPEVEGIAALGQVDDVLSMQGIVGHRAVDGFLHPQPFAVVLERRRGAGLHHLLELPALFPGVAPGAVTRRAANRVAGYGVGCRRVDDTQLLKIVFPASMK